MAVEPIVVQVEDKVAASIQPKLAAIGTAAKTSYTALQQLQKMLASLNGGALSQLQNQLKQSAQAMQLLVTAQTNLTTANAKALLVLQRVATEAQRTQIQMANLATAQQKTAIQTQMLAVAQQAAAAAALKTASALVNLTTAQNNAATAAQRLATEQQRTAQAITQANTAVIQQGTAANQALIAQQRLIEAQNKAARSAVDLTTAQQRLATEQQRTAVQTQNAAAAADRARLAALQLANAQNQLQNSTNGAANSMIAYARAAAFAVGTAMGAESILKTADAYTLMQNKLTNVAHTQESVNLLTGEMFSLSNRTAQSVATTTSMFQKFDNALKQMGGGQVETLRLVETLNKATIVSGATMTEAASGVLQLSQAFGSGRLQGDEFRSIMENLPVVADMIASHMGKTRGELKKLSSQGKITAEVMREAFAKAAEDIDAKFGKTTFTLAQQMLILNNKFTMFIGELNKSIGLTAGLSQVVKVLGNNFEAAAVSLSFFSSLLLVAFGPNLIRMISAATLSVRGFTVALATNPIGLLIVGITTASTAIALFGDDLKVTSDNLVTFKDLFRTAFSFIVDGFKSTSAFIMAAWGTAIDFLNQYTGGFAEKFRDIFGFILATAKTNTNFLVGLFVGGYNAITKYWGLLPNIMKTIFNSVVNYGMDAVETLANAWQLGVRAISKIAGYVAPSMADSLNKALDSLTIHMPRMEVGKTATQMATEIGKEFTDAFTKDYVGDAADAFMKRAHDIAITRVGINTGPGELRGASDIDKVTPDDPKAIKAAERRASALAKINGELDKQLNTMFTLNPQRAIDQEFDQIQINLAQKKIKLTNDEAESIKAKITQVNLNKELQQTFDSVYAESTQVSKQYNLTLQAANMLLAQGAITTKQYEVSINKATESYLNATDPLREFTKGIEDQLKVLKMVGPAAEIESQVLQKQNELRAEGKSLTDIEAAQMRSKLMLVQEATNLQSVLNAQYADTIGKQTELTTRQQAYNQMLADGTMNGQQYSIAMQQLAIDSANLKLAMGTGGFEDVITSSMGQILSGYQGVLSGLSSAWGDFFTSFTDGFADSMGRAIVYSESLSEAMSNISKQILSGLISALIKLGIQYAVNAAMGTSIGASAMAAQTGLSVAAAATTAAAWATPAALVSLASFGANSAAAAAGITATVGLSQGIALMSSFPGFEDGGYTGGGGRSSIAGVVHGQEFVATAEATRRNRPVLEAMNAGATIGSSGSSGGATANVVNQITIINNANGTEVTTAERDDGNGNMELVVMIDSVENALASRMTSGRGSLHNATRGAFGLTPKTGR